jgi:hypothetical protein
MAGILDLLTQPANTGFAPAPQSASPFASLLQGLGSINFAHMPQRPQPDMSGIHPLVAQLMSKLVAAPSPLPSIPLPSAHIPSAAQTMATTNAIAAGRSPFGAQSAPQ